MAERRPVKPGELMGLAAAAGQEARAAAARRRLAQLRLTDEERRVATDELAEQFAVGRLDELELHRRVDLLNDAVTHGDLQPIFAGLPTPSLYKPAARKPGKWRWAAFAGAVWMAVPFVLVGLLMLVFGREIAAAIFGLPALAWVFFTYRWASRPRREDRRQSGA
ncbi:DUF1707 SHOCT-like domain-containing protein [Kribbella pratensis]|jgi:hypothetical protein|uniref:Uncharacterized protein DUF1707 n=1 Tax=Kribbella pratensis TaxID=2512112 RepID=A0A4R8BSN4_9ACTN|nr:DUF1707 domain-containing protein [Kribbella pratensis]TDW60805.1 uncharacterized protein DUF1707 [Kribbella pratensis]